MKPIQRYLVLVASIRLRWMLLVFVAAYLSAVCAFAFGFYVTGSVRCSGASPCTLRFTDLVYFSFVSQATIGYGDFYPIGIGRLLTIAQGLVGMIIVALGTGAIVYRFLTPDRKAIEFDKIMVFDPIEKCFRVRFVNRLPVPFECYRIEMRLRYRRSTARGEVKWSRKTVVLVRGSVTELPSLKPFLLSTKRIENPIHHRDFKFGEEIVLEPAHISPESSLRLLLETNSPVGTSIFSTNWPADAIRCGRFVSTYNDADTGIVDWNKWGVVAQFESCNDCIFEKGCGLTQRKAQPVVSPDGFATR